MLTFSVLLLSAQIFPFLLLHWTIVITSSVNSATSPFSKCILPQLVGFPLIEPLLLHFGRLSSVSSLADNVLRGVDRLIPHFQTRQIRIP